MRSMNFPCLSSWLTWEHKIVSESKLMETILKGWNNGAAKQWLTPSASCLSAVPSLISKAAALLFSSSMRNILIKLKVAK